ncbi:MAG: hypothetical protein K2W81_02965 [Sphingomonas sp.]|uniref:hypothetical protein n=1 Tax=Sphingomonas sp. TaxID=28214 RepID=UPI0025D84A97|nr:hypothetical protein [Sphingomonas sp.]MBY0282910.1 hypothetical protein [Sphingomonas sp.]
MNFRFAALAMPIALCGAAPEPDLCARVTAITPLACAQSARGIALAVDDATAQRLLGDAEAGAERFMSRFGAAPPGLYAVYRPEESLPDGTKVQALRTAGFTAILPWISPKFRRAQIETSVRAGVTARMPGQPPEAIDAAVKADIAKLTLLFSDEAQVKLEKTTIPHELGHMWYGRLYWPNASIDGPSHYGAPGPDWLDETAAILMEDDASLASRTEQFAMNYRRYRADPAKATPGLRMLVDLPAFFEEKHPGADRVRELLEKRKQQGAQNSPVIVLGGAEIKSANNLDDRFIGFYLQGTVASSYMIERSGDPKIFGRIGAAFGRGETMAQWLANAEPKGKLPRDLKALQADWLSWLDKRFPAEPAKPA